MRVVLAASLFFSGDASRNFFVVPAPQVAHSAPATMTYGYTSLPGPSMVLAPQPQIASRGWSDVAMLAVAGAVAGAAGSLAVRRAGSIQMQEEEAAAPSTQLATRTTRSDIAPGTFSPADLEAQDGLVLLAKELNPAVGFWDPLKLSELEFWEQSNESTIGFLRHAEIKHGRVAMAGFVGFLVHANGIHFPWKIPGDELCAPGVSPPLLWDNMPLVAKVQIITAIAIFEAYSEAGMAKAPGQGGHYMRGGKPGYFPPFILRGGGKSGVGTLEDEDGGALLPHPVPLNLYDPLNFNKNKSDEWKAKKLKIELNNGRLAMLGLMSLLSEGAIPGSVPALKGLIPESGAINVMRPFDFKTSFDFGF
jgi:hypothetical protein